MPEVFIKIEKLAKAFHDTPVLRGIDLDIAEGDLVVLIGKSGCGKSTLLRCLNGLEIFDSGNIAINGLSLARRHPDARKDGGFARQAQEIRKHVGMVFQSFNLFPHLTLLQNVIKAPVVVKGMTTNEAEGLALKLLDKVGLSGHVNHYPSQLSGGQQQRGAIARALAMEPRVLLYDEPTSALDPSLTDEVWQVMRTLDAEGMTQIVVTHEHRVARGCADRAIFMDWGLIVEDAPPEKLFSNPQDPRTREFLKHSLEPRS